MFLTDTSPYVSFDIKANLTRHSFAFIAKGEKMKIVGMKDGWYITQKGMKIRTERVLPVGGILEKLKTGGFLLLNHKRRPLCVIKSIEIKG